MLSSGPLSFKSAISSVTGVSPWPCSSSVVVVVGSIVGFDLSSASAGIWSEISVDLSSIWLWVESVVSFAVD